MGIQGETSSGTQIGIVVVMQTNKMTQTDVHKILVIEDEGDMRLLLEILLRSRDVELSHVNNLFDAQQFLKHEHPELILLDNRLPDGYGVDFIGYIKKKYPGIKIIMISGVDAAAQDLALEIGADSFLPKPFTKQQLHESIDRLLN
jgi:DNA-binding NtrC family response regulator